MPTAILTFQESSNNGALLQAYALQTVVGKITGERCDIINYHSAHKAIFYQNADKKELLIYLNRKLSSKINDVIQKKANAFKNRYLNITKTVYNSASEMKELNTIYSKFICGSDQVWNPANTGADEVFFLNFVKDDSKIISYAPSIALEKLPEDLEEKYKKNISRFRHLSIREKSGWSIIKELLDREAEIVLDPVFLLNTQEWDMVAKEIDIEVPYICIYHISYRPQMIKFARKLRKKTSLRVVMVIQTIRDLFVCIANGFTAAIVSPEEFVGVISNAEYVITNSFHGTAFSICYNKNMFVFGNKGKMKSANSRITDLLSTMGLEKRFVSDDQFNDLESVINNAIKDNLQTSLSLEEKRNESYKYLHTALE